MNSAPKLEVRWGAATDVGQRRKINEDSYLAKAPFFLVADGMGGHEAGEVASRLAIEAFEPLVGQDSVDPAALHRCIQKAAQTVHDLGSESSAPGSTLTGVALSSQGKYPCLWVLNIGDSRTYRVGAGSFTRVTTDHSEVQELVDAGTLAAADAVRSPHRNIITRALGGASGPGVQADHYLLPALEGDRFIVCSDGLSGEVTEVLIEMIARSVPDPQAAAEELVSQALTAGGRDNVTVVVVDITAAWPEWPTGDVGDTTLGASSAEDTLPGKNAQRGKGV